MTRPPADSSTPAFDDTVEADHAGVAGHPVAAEVQAAAERRYQLLDEVARGGAGRVVRARDLALDRIVAVKEPLVPGGGARLHEEAAVLARLQHPSVVPIYDVGVRADGVPFFAMKLVDGRPLRDALREAGSLDGRLRYLPHVLAVAEAVAFAHQAGVVHRDLKPANVLVGDLGETAVIDWGLACDRDPGDGAAPPAGGRSTDDAGATTATAESTTERTTDGATGDGGATPSSAATPAAAIVVGTPAFMPPEQARGEPVDERADVYALGGILYQLLTGQAPYADRRDRRDRPALDHVLAGPPTPVADLQPRVPRDLDAIVTKAMARDPARRYRNARELAADLERFQTGRLVSARRYSPVTRARRWLARRRAAVAIAVAGLAVAAGAVAIATRPASGARTGPTCDLAGAAVDEVWNQGARDRVATSFAATGVAHAAAVSRAATERLDGYADRLRAAHVEACVATLRAGQSQTVLERRKACLDQRVVEIAALLDELGRADPALIDRAPAAVASLPGPDACRRVEELSSLPPEPADPAARAHLAELRSRAVRVAAAVWVRREAEVAELAPALVRDARAAGYPPVTAMAAHLAGRVTYATASDEAGRRAALPLLHEAIAQADAGHDDLRRARATIDLLEVSAGLDPTSPELTALTEAARAVVARAGNDQARYKLLVVTGNNQRVAGRLDDAIASFEQAFASPGWKAAPDGAMMVNLAIAYRAKGELDRALELGQTGLAALRADYGDDHPTVAKAHGLVAAIHVARGESDAARREAQRGLDIYLRLHGPEHRDVIIARGMLIGSMLQGGHFREVRDQLEPLLPVARGVMGDEHPLIGVLESNLAEACLHTGDLDRAEELTRAGLARRLRTLGANHPATATAHHQLATILVERGDAAGAIAEERRAIAIQSEALAAESPDLARSRMSLAVALLDAGRPREAVAPAEQAAAVLTALADATAAAEAELTLARALWDTGRDRARARTLAGSAAARTGVDADLAGRITRWRDEHP